ncbi:uncharacterized protein [Nicotiana tomentosiformis]|uniref:uncharacterized protein n=1 Tax=Nicotiana tomentosiformis TaxID=4098 RepID=UPI00388CAD29
MYHDLKEIYWWNGMKRNVVEFVARYPNCQQVKDEHQRPVKSTDTPEQYAQLYIKKIVRVHSTPVSIITNPGAQFTVNVWKKFQQDLGTQGSWDDHLSLIEFAYNNSFHASIHMAPFEALYGRRYRTPIGWFEIGEDENLEFQEDDWVFLKVFPMNGTMWFGKKVVGDLSAIMLVEAIKVNEELSYEEISVAILDRQV